jgi:hypothetical protein
MHGVRNGLMNVSRLVFLVRHVDLQVDNNVSEEHTASIFKAEDPEDHFLPAIALHLKCVEYVDSGLLGCEAE